MISKLLTAVTGGTLLEDDDRIFECDRCGTNVDHPDDSCTHCEDSRIVVYEF